jgi:Fe-S cluster biosynthesis and repair protein YggX
MSEESEVRLVQCIKVGEELPGMRRQPFPTEFGTFVFENLSQQGWAMWLEESVRYINTYRIDLASKEGTDFLLKQMRIWLGLEEGEQAETAWTPPEDASEPESSEA